MWMTSMIKCYIGDKIKCNGPDDRFSDYRVSGVNFLVCPVLAKYKVLPIFLQIL